MYLKYVTVRSNDLTIKIHLYVKYIKICTDSNDKKYIIIILYNFYVHNNNMLFILTNQ